jgi:Zn-dependent protease
MGENVRLGRVAGIEIHASWSLLVILGLITWSLAAATLPAAAPDAPAVACWAVAASGAVLFLGCLLAHELAHSLVATSRGMRVDGITLWMFGGVSRLGGEPPDPRTERRMALAGPLTSLALGAAFMALTLLLWAVAPRVVLGALAWLGLMNVALAVFNLLPAYPLDGGRVLRAAVWARTGSRARATVVAATWGIWCGNVLVALGALLALWAAALSGVWLALLGWIVRSLARSERDRAELGGLLGGVRVGDVMTPDPVTVPADLSVDELVRHYVTLYRCSAFPVTSPDGTLAGLVALSRLRHVPASLRATTPVGSLAVPLDRVVTARPDDTLAQLLGRVTSGSGRRALVLDEDGRLVGIVTAHDIERVLEIAGLAGPDALAGTRS